MRASHERDMSPYRRTVYVCAVASFTIAEIPRSDPELSCLPRDARLARSKKKIFKVLLLVDFHGSLQGTEFARLSLRH